MMLVVLGAMAGIAVAAVNGPASLSSIPTLPTLATVRTTTTTTAPRSTSTSTTTTEPRTTTTSSPTIVDQALIQECVGDVTSVDSALSAYEATHGSPPPAGTAWAKGILQSWPDGGLTFTLRWTGTEVVVAPVHGRASSGGAGTQSPTRTGCYAAY